MHFKAVPLSLLVSPQIHTGEMESEEGDQSPATVNQILGQCGRANLEAASLPARVAVVIGIAENLRHKIFITHNVKAIVESSYILLKLRWAVCDVLQTAAVLRIQPRDDAADAAYGFVNYRAVLFPKLQSSVWISSDQRFGDI